MFKILFIMFLYLFLMNFWNFMYIMIFIYLIMLLYYPSFFNLNLNMLIYIDNLNYWLILMTIWIIFLMIMSMNMIKFSLNNEILMVFMLMMMFIFLYYSFLVFNFLMFYMFFEMSLIPTMYLILGWGYQPERISAGLYLLLYTLFASLPLLLSILFLNFFVNSLIMLNFLNFFFMNKMIYFGFIMAFLVKMPMFIVHLWLPKAHVEAPVSGSMILAAILLKLGGYGLLRFFSFLIKFKNLNLLFMMISILGGILISLNCLRQLDLKMLIAYSSVSHMGLVLGGLFTNSIWGISGSFLMMIAHGLCSSGLFCLSNICYERFYSRSLIINKGLVNFMPFMSLWWFLLCSSNMSAPLSLNLISEIKLINSLMSWCYLNLFLMFLLCFFSASYSYYLYLYSQHGNYFSSIFSFSNNNQREYLLIILHWFPLNILFLKILFL